MTDQIIGYHINVKTHGFWLGKLFPLAVSVFTIHLWCTDTILWYLNIKLGCTVTKPSGTPVVTLCFSFGFPVARHLVFLCSVILNYVFPCLIISSHRDFVVFYWFVAYYHILVLSNLTMLSIIFLDTSTSTVYFYVWFECHTPLMWMTTIVDFEIE